ncbi:MAG: hypothetical protein IPL46_07220 [Saprospiraceae bacterium]|nr:hypothetical protein [Saprospiraceae bacterium]
MGRYHMHESIPTSISYLSTPADRIPPVMGIEVSYDVQLIISTIRKAVSINMTRSLINESEMVTKKQWVSV